MYLVKTNQRFSLKPTGVDAQLKPIGKRFNVGWKGSAYANNKVNQF